MAFVRQTLLLTLVLAAGLSSGVALVGGTASLALAQSGRSEGDSEQATEEGEEGTQEGDADAEARGHFEAATEYFDSTEYEDALLEFRRAYVSASLSARPALLFNIASTLERLGRFNDSADALERYLREAEEPESPARLRARIVSLRRRADANRPAEDGGGSEGLIVGGAVALAVAGAGLVGFGVFGGLALAEDGALQDGCFSSRSCTPENVSTLDTLTLAADISWIGAAVAGVTGVVLLIVGLSDDGDDGAVSFLPVMGPTEAGVSLRGGF